MHGTKPGSVTPETHTAILHRQALRLLAIVQCELENDTTDFDRAFDYASKALAAIETLRIIGGSE